MIPELNITTPETWVQSECGGTVAVDFETFYTSSYSVAKLGLWAYIHDSRFDAYLVAVSDGERTCVCPPSEFPWASIERRTWVSHNRDFDRAVFDRLQELGTIPLASAIPGAWVCSAALCAYLQLPRDLAGAVKSVFGQILDKAPRARAKGQRPTEDFFHAAEMIRYAGQDALACLALWNHLERHWPLHERCLFDLTSQMGHQGLAVAWDYVRAKRLELEDLIDSIAGALPWKPAMSVKQFEAACEQIGIPAPPSTSNADAEFADWLKTYTDSGAANWARHIQRIRSANRTAKVMQSMEARRMPSGRMAYELKYFGASTGRWSGGGGLNLQNLNRKTAEGVDLRHAIVAPPSHVLAVADYSQIENRVLLFLAGDVEALALFRDNPNADAYEIHARRTMGYAEAEPLKEWCERTGSNLRQLAKARALGLGFGCGWRKFIDVARVMAGLELGEYEAKRIVADFRRSNVLVVSLWNRLQDACIACDGRHYALPLPCTQHNPALKRFLLYRDVAVTDNDIAATVAGERVHVYGGLIAENWTQGTARDILGSAWLRCARAGFLPVLSVHDELVFELPEATADQDLARIISIMETPVPWAPHLPLKVEGKLMPFYAK
jgi:DNA polymerase I-like protein with 3'-5' exonuclease and polymerase domains